MAGAADGTDGPVKATGRDVGDAVGEVMPGGRQHAGQSQQGGFGAHGTSGR